MQGYWEGWIERCGQTLEEQLFVENGSLAVCKEMLEACEPGCQLGPVSQVGVALYVLSKLLVPLFLLFAERFTHANYKLSDIHDLRIAIQTHQSSTITIIP